MPAPTSSSFLRPDLGEYFEAFDVASARMGYIGPQVLTPFPVSKTSANFSTITIGQYLQRHRTARAPGAGYNRAEWTFGQDNFSTEENGIEEPVDDRDKHGYSYTGIEMEMISAERARFCVLHELEIAAATALYSTSTFSSTNITNEWDDSSNATPLADLTNGINSFIEAYGMTPNTIVLNDVQIRRLKLCDETVDRLKYWGGDDPKTIGANTLVGYFRESGIEQVLVGTGRYNTADEGQTVSLSPIWDSEKCGIFRIGKTQDMREACVGRTFYFTGDGASEMGTLEQYRDEKIRGEVIRFRLDYDLKITDSNAGYILNNLET